VLKTHWINWWIKIIEMDPPNLGMLYQKIAKIDDTLWVPPGSPPPSHNKPTLQTQDHVGGTVDVDLEIKALRVVDKARGRQGKTVENAFQVLINLG
jgi:hypothetical protein